MSSEEKLGSEKISPSEAWDQWLSGKRPGWPLARDWLWKAVSPELVPLHLTWAFTLGLTIFAAVAWREATHSTSALQGQIKELRADRRPWLYPTEANISPFISPKVFLGRADDLFLIYRIKIKNVGRTPAQIVIMGSSLKYKMDYWPQDKKNDYCQSFQHINAKYKIFGTVFPGQDINIDTSAVSFKDDWIKKNKIENSFLYSVSLVA